MRSWLPEGVSTYSGSIDHMFYMILWVTGIGFIVTEVVLFAFAFMYRSRPGRRATYTHGNGKLEIIWTVVPAAFFVFLGFMSQNVWSSIKGHVPHTDEEVTVTASQFNWEIRYKGKDGAFDTPDDVVTSNDMRLPVDVPVKIRLRSKDVIHSFFLPNARLKQDALPGKTIPVWFAVTEHNSELDPNLKRWVEIGGYEKGKPRRPDMIWELACAEFCGTRHSMMRGKLYVHKDKADFLAWLKQAEAEQNSHEPVPQTPVAAR